MITYGGLYLTSGYLNNENVSTTLFNSLSYPKGNLGRLFGYNDSIAAKLSVAPTTRTLFNGVYQLVNFLTGSTASNAVGQAVFWSDRSNFVVTPDASATAEADFAGITLNTVTKGSYGIIQVCGKASIQYRGTVTSKVTQNLVLQLTTTNTFDAIADATGSYISGGTLGIKSIVGICLEAPTDGGIKLASIFYRNLNFA